MRFYDDLLVIILVIMHNTKILHNIIYSTDCFNIISIYSIQYKLKEAIKLRLNAKIKSRCT